MRNQQWITARGTDKSVARRITMFNLTKRSMDHFLNLFKKEDKDEKIKEFCQTEYKKDWYAAYMTFKQEGRFPNFIRRTL